MAHFLRREHPVLVCALCGQERDPLPLNDWCIYCNSSSHIRHLCGALPDDHPVLNRIAELLEEAERLLIEAAHAEGLLTEARHALAAPSASHSDEDDHHDEDWGERPRDPRDPAWWETDVELFERIRREAAAQSGPDNLEQAAPVAGAASAGARPTVWPPQQPAPHPFPPEPPASAPPAASASVEAAAATRQ